MQLNLKIIELEYIGRKKQTLLCNDLHFSVLAS